MTPDQRLVIKLPLDELWDERGPVAARQVEKACGAARLRELLRRGPPAFVVADIGSPIRWIDPRDAFSFWRNEVEPHLAEPEQRILLDEFPDQFAYVASIWDGPSGTVVVLEMRH